MFAMRKSLVMALALTSVGMEDDDGQKGGEMPKVSEEQVANIKTLLEEVGGDEELFLKMCKVGAIADIRAQTYDDVIKRLEGKRK